MLESFKEQKIPFLMDSHWILTKHSLTSKNFANIMAGMSSMFDIFFCPQLIFVHSWYTHFQSVLFAINEKRGFVELLYSAWALVFGASHSGAVLLGGRFRCLKYWVTCWGSSARTDLARVSLGAWERKRAGEHINSYKNMEQNEGWKRLEYGDCGPVLSDISSLALVYACPVRRPKAGWWLCDVCVLLVFFFQAPYIQRRDT